MSGPPLQISIFNSLNPGLRILIQFFPMVGSECYSQIRLRIFQTIGAEFGTIFLEGRNRMNPTRIRNPAYTRIKEKGAGREKWKL